MYIQTVFSVGLLSIHTDGVQCGDAEYTYRRCSMWGCWVYIQSVFHVGLLGMLTVGVLFVTEGCNYSL